MAGPPRRGSHGACSDPRPGIVQARRAGGLSQEEVAERAGTSRPTSSSYEHSPTLKTTALILAAAGFALDAVPINSAPHPESTAGIGDFRNEENLIVAQRHTRPASAANVEVTLRTVINTGC